NVEPSMPPKKRKIKLDDSMASSAFCLAKRAEQEEGPVSHVIQLHISDVASIPDPGVMAPRKEINGFSWRLFVCTRTHPTRIHLECGFNQSRLWFTRANLYLTITAPNKPVYSEIYENYRFSNSSTGFRSSSLDMEFQNGELRDASSFTVEARIECIGPDASTFRQDPRPLGFLNPNDYFDCVLSMSETKIYVNKKKLSRHSPYFEALFSQRYKEANQKEITIEDADPQHFVKLLHLVHRGDVSLINTQDLNEESAEGILRLADLFQFSDTVTDVEMFLLHEDCQMKMGKKLGLAERYRLLTLKDECIDKLRTSEEIQSIRKSEEYSQLSQETRELIFEKTLKLWEDAPKPIVL
ncbi:hypothetical protein PFISCL1PPCAC_5509, partial [Pristionchus fissidentatus]